LSTKKRTPKKSAKTRNVHNYNDVKKYLDSEIEKVKDGLEPTFAALDDSDRDLMKGQMKLEASIPILNGGLERLHEKFDNHISEEYAEFSTIRNELTRAAAHTKEIQITLDSVSANGNKGLSASFTDIYNKLVTLEQITEGARARAKFWKLLHDMVETTPLLKPFKYKWGAVVYILFLIVIFNTMFHAFGLELNIIPLFKWIFEWIKNGGL